MNNELVGFFMPFFVTFFPSHKSASLYSIDNLYTIWIRSTRQLKCPNGMHKTDKLHPRNNLWSW